MRMRWALATGEGHRGRFEAEVVRAPTSTGTSAACGSRAAPESPIWIWRRVEAGELTLAAPHTHQGLDALQVSATLRGESVDA